jgi:GNAT superfamily N-acetyltransferase
MQRVAAASRAHHDLAFSVVEASDAGAARLREDLLETWVAVTDAGGSVGFTAPADAAEIGAALDRALQRVADGSDLLGIVTRDGRARGMGLLVDSGSPLQRHWRTVLRLMVHPELQGAGAGALLLEGLDRKARDLGLEQLALTVRAGCGLERFYERFGYRVVGSHPGALRVAPGDDRDEVMMVKQLGA